MTAAAPDLLDMLEADAEQSALLPGRIRDEWLKAIQTINDRDGDFGSGRVIATVPEWARGPQSGSTVTGLVRSGAARWTGRWEPLGNYAQRAGDRQVKVYRLTRQVWPEPTPNPTPGEPS